MQSARATVDATVAERPGRAQSGSGDRLDLWVILTGRHDDDAMDPTRP